MTTLGLRVSLRGLRRPSAVGGDSTPGGATHTYVRPDTTSVYLRPDGSSLYVRP